MECGQEDTYWRGSLTSPESVGLLLLHWVNGTLALGQADDAEPVSSATLLSQVQGSSAWDLSLGRNGSDTAVVMQGGSSAGVEQSRDLLDTLETCSGSTIYVIAAPMVPTHTPNTDLNKIPGLQVRVLFLEVPIGWARVVVVVVGEGEEGGGGCSRACWCRGKGEREKRDDLMRWEPCGTRTHGPKRRRPGKPPRPSPPPTTSAFNEPECNE